jgi:hypothetical protein
LHTYSSSLHSQDSQKPYIQFMPCLIQSSLNTIIQKLFISDDSSLTNNCHNCPQYNPSFPFLVNLICLWSLIPLTTVSLLGFYHLDIFYTNATFFCLLYGCHYFCLHPRVQPFTLFSLHTFTLADLTDTQWKQSFLAPMASPKPSNSKCLSSGFKDKWRD